MKKGWLIIVVVALVAGILTFPRPAGAPTPLQHIVNRLSPKQEPVVIGFGGDLMFDRYIRQKAELLGYDAILAPLAPLFSSHDVVVANLEGSVTTFESVSQGSKPLEQNNYVFTFSPKTVEALTSANIGVLSLANNHVFNFGNPGLSQTKQHLSDVGLSYFGEPFAQTHHIQDIRGTRIGFVGFNEFFPPGKDDVVATIRSLATTTDFVVVFTHWGYEYTNEPNEYQKALAREFIDAGADFIVGGHPHVIQTRETYNGKDIYYSLGNLVFDQYWNDNVRCGLFVTLSINPEDFSYTTKETTVYLEKDGTTIQKECGNERVSAL
ncbi:MAG: hypothetical protein AMXMBFR44_2790 [Candidatus Campbellbacteria bacterium]